MAARRPLVRLAVAACCSQLLSPGIAAQALVELEHPIMFVTQVPSTTSLGSVADVFSNHQPSMHAAGRGGDLWIRYPDGSLRNLTAEAGYGVAGGHQQSPAVAGDPDFPSLGDPFGTSGGIAVRDPEVHWSGERAVFAMAIGSPARYQTPTMRWQLYEVSGIGQGETVSITRVPNQPRYNNIQPFYLSDDRIAFASDRPRSGEPHLHPQLDEYESLPVVAGLYALQPQSGQLDMLTHSPSGDFNPSLASDGRIVFTRWDHLIRDQQADADWFNGGQFGSFTYADESADAERMPLDPYHEVFPEPRQANYRDALYPGSIEMPHAFNFFLPWQVNQDGSELETLNHIGRHELLGFFTRSRSDDASLVDFNFQSPQRANDNAVDFLLELRESPVIPGRFVGIRATEFGTRAAGQVIAIDGMQVGNSATLARTSGITHIDTFGFNADNAPADPGDSGKYRSPTPLADGRVLVSHTDETRSDRDEGSTSDGTFGGQTVPIHRPQARYRFRLALLQPSGDTAVAGPLLTGPDGLRKTLSFWSPDHLDQYEDVELWELDPVEVRARPVPPMRVETALAAPEAGVFAAAGVSPSAFREWLRERDLALLVSRDVTTRDHADRQQPFNLAVPGGVQTLAVDAPQAPVRNLRWWQLYQGDQVRGIGGTANPRPGRRVLARALHDAVEHNPASDGPPGTVGIALDGSVAAIVPAQRALSWALLDNDAEAVVRERVWLSAQPGEIRVCASCHGANDVTQAGTPSPVNAPLALQALLEYWKASQATGTAFFRDGFETATAGTGRAR